MNHRAKSVLEFWDRSKELSIENNGYRDFANQFLSILLRHDISQGDMTSNSLIKKDKNISAVIVAEENGMFAGLEEFKLLNGDLKINPVKNDGDKIKKGDILIKMKGPAKKILARERTSLNLLQRMSGIATLTDRLAKKIDNARIMATRKTLWGSLDKKAVSIGRGLTHRLSLNDGVIIKENHLKILQYNIEKALKLVKSKSHYIEIEVENKKDALAAAGIIKKLSKNKNLFAIMFDKIKPEEIKSIIKELKNGNLYDYALLEASGNINPDNLNEYANCGVDAISMGYITNSAKVLNLSQEIIK